MIVEALENIIFFDKRWCFFAINNVCNNRCEMCSIWKESPKIVRLEDAKKVIDKLCKNNFSVLQLTGGEPLLNPDFFEIVKYAKGRGLFVFAPTNGTLIDEKMADGIRDSKIDQISISFHHTNPEKFEKITGQKDILKKVTRSIELLNERKVPVSLLCTITMENKDDIEDIVKFVDRFNATISFCIPTKVEGTTFRLGGDEGYRNPSREDMENVLNKIIDLKKQRYNIANSVEYIRDAIRFYNGQSKYPCFGGSKLFYIDWNLNVFPCMCKGQPKGIESYDFNTKADPCNECAIQCFREPSVLLHSRKRTVRIFLQESPHLLLMASKRLKTVLS